MFRYNPDLEKEGENPMKLDYKGPKIDVKNFMYQETRFKMVEKLNENNAKEYLETARVHAKNQFKRYKNIAELSAKGEI
jgi:pyruvate-ferredoxin/flavodoxin oxidoreductase